MQLGDASVLFLGCDWLDSASKNNKIGHAFLKTELYQYHNKKYNRP